MFDTIGEFFLDFNGYKLFLLIIMIGIFVAAIVAVVGALRFFINGWPNTRFYLYAIGIVALIGLLYAMCGDWFGIALLVLSTLIMIGIAAFFVMRLRILEEFSLYMALVAVVVGALAVFCLLFVGLLGEKTTFTIAAILEGVVSLIMGIRLTA